MMREKLFSPVFPNRRDNGIDNRSAPHVIRLTATMHAMTYP